MIGMDRVTHRFDKSAQDALHDVSFEISPGTLCGLIGPDGAGKTTLLRIAAGVFTPLRGMVRVAGRFGYMPQRFSLYEECSVGENLELFGRLQGVPKETIRRRGDALLERTALFPFRDRLAGRLSGGMKQKLALTVALLHDPELLILDEPGTGVDPVSRREIWRELYRLHKEGRTVVVATPYMDEAQLCSSLIFLSQGRVREKGTPKEICDAYPLTVLRLTVPGRRDLRAVLAACPLEECHVFGGAWHLTVRDEEKARRALKATLGQVGVPEYELVVIPPSLEDVFVHRAGA